MDIKELTHKMHSFVEKNAWYQLNSPKPQTPANLAKSLVIEAAELLEHFQWQDEIADRQGLEEELADVALYLLQLASVSEIDLEQAILEKLTKNQSRQWD